MAAGGAVVLAACQPQSTAVGWRTAATVTVAKGTAQFASIAAVSPGDAWAVGRTVSSASKQAPLVERWTGSSWQQVRFSPMAAKTWASWGFSKDAVIAASSATDVWVFSGVRAIRYARYNGHGWAFGTVPGTTLGKRPKALTIVSTAVILSPTDAWVFGLRLATGAPGTVTPYAAQFTVHGWVDRTVPGAGSIAAVTVVSPKDILALVGTDAEAGLGANTPTVVRWNGRTWTALPVQPTGLPADNAATTMAAFGGHIWIGGDFYKQIDTRANFVDELTGSAWHITDLPDSASVADFRLSSLVLDGSGGLWALGTSTSPGVTQRIWHLTNGVWQSPLRPRFGGSTGSLLQLAAVPGTHSVWGAGVRLSSNSRDGLIAVEGPTPR